MPPRLSLWRWRRWWTTGWLAAPRRRCASLAGSSSRRRPWPSAAKTILHPDRAAPPAPDDLPDETLAAMRTARRHCRPLELRCLTLASRAWIPTAAGSTDPAS